MEDLNKQYIVQGDSSTSFLQVSNCFGDILIDTLYCTKTKHSFLERIKINSEQKAKKIICSNRGRHRMYWLKIYKTDRSGGIHTEYLIFYYPVRRAAVMVARVKTLNFILFILFLC